MKLLIATLVIAVPLVLGILGGCSSAPVHLKHPDTGEMAQCGPYLSTGMAATGGALREAQCINDYKEQGYLRVKN